MKLQCGMQNDGMSSYGELSANINASDLHGFLNMSQDDRIGDDYASLLVGSGPFDVRERPKTGNDKLRATFDKFFTVAAKNKSPHRRDQTPQYRSTITEKNLPPLKSIPWQEQAKMLQIIKPGEEKSQKTTPTQDRKGPKVGIQKLQEIGQSLGLDPKKENILDPKVLEKWINETLLEVERGEATNAVVATEKKAPLVRYGLDRQTLIAYGLKKDNIDRLFRCLFIYSAGFYELLSNIFDHTVRKFNLVGSVWKVFWILLEYCYKADHQTILEEVQVENRDLVERLKRDLDAKIKETEGFERWQMETLHKIKQEVDNLKMEKDGIYREKMQLEEEIRINEKVYGEEVQLRIKFETKVNEVYAVAKDLKSKHQRTLEELVKLQEEREEDQKMIAELNGQIKTLTEKTFDANYKNKLYLEKISLKDRAVEDLRMNAVNLENKLSDALVENEAINNRMLIVANDELKLEIQALITLNKTLKANVDEYKITITGLEQDKQRLADKLKEINSIADKKIEDFNSMQKEILAVKYQLEKVEQNEKTLEEQLEAIQKEKTTYEIENSMLKNNLEAEKEKSAQINTDYTLALESVKELTEIRIENDTQIRKDKQIKEELKRELMTRDRAIEDIGTQRDLAYKQIDELKAMVVDLETKLAHARDENTIQLTDFESKDEHLRKAIDKEKEQKDEWFQRFKTLQRDLAKQSQQILELQGHLQLEKQSKTTLEMRIAQAKEVNEQIEARSKDMRQRFEDLTYTLNGLKRDYASLEELNNKILSDKAHEINNLRKECEQKILLTERGMHPMYIEDMWSRAAEALQRARNAEYKLISTQIENEELHEQNESLRKHVKNLSDQLSAAIAAHEALKEETKDNDYKKIKQVQELDVLKEKIEIYQKQSVEAQHKYKEIVQEIATKDREVLQLEQEIEKINYEYNILYTKYNELKLKKRHRSAEKKHSEEGSKSKSRKEERESKGKPAMVEAQKHRTGDQPKSETNLDGAKTDESLFNDVRGTRPRSQTQALKPTRTNDDRKNGDLLDKSPERTGSRGRESANKREQTNFERIPENFQEGSSSELSLGERGQNEERHRPVTFEDMLAYATNHIGMLRGIDSSFFGDHDAESSKHDVESRVSTKKSKKSRERHESPGEGEGKKEKKKKNKKDKEKKEHKGKEKKKKKERLDEKGEDADYAKPYEQRPESSKSKRSDREESKVEGENLRRKSQEEEENREVSRKSEQFNKESSSSSISGSSSSDSSGDEQQEESNGSDDTPSSYYQNVLGMEFPMKERTINTQGSLEERPISKGKTGYSKNSDVRQPSEGEIRERLYSSGKNRNDPEGWGEQRESLPDDESSHAENQQRSALYNNAGISLDPSYQPRSEVVNSRLARIDDMSSLNKQQVEDKRTLEDQKEDASESEIWKRQKIFDLPETHEKFPFDNTKRPLSREFIKRDTVGSRSSSNDDKNVTRNIFMNTFTKIMEGINEEQKLGERERLPAFAETQFDFGKSRGNKGLPADSLGIQGKSLKTSLMPGRSMRARGVTSVDKRQKNTVAPVDEPDRYVEYRKTIREKMSKIQGVPPKQTKDPVFPQSSGPQAPQFIGQGMSKTIQMTKYKYG